MEQVLGERFDILGVNVSATNPRGAVRRINDWISQKRKTYVCVSPVSTLIDCQRDATYRKIVNDAGMITPDGMPLVWMGRLRGLKEVRRTYGPDLMLVLCEEGQNKGYRHYLYGGTENTCSLLRDTLKKKFPRINIVGHYAPPFRDTDDIEDEKLINEINRLSPDILWVGLGSPKQDFWMANHRDKLDVPVMVGVGAAFDFIAGVKKQAPRWMQRCGLEWLFRLCCEPRRLWKRYLLGNAKFIYLLLKSFFKRKA